ncbi:MAG: SDR family oxidoreductase [Chloroflexi bacterium]|nr:SDR family oxidoreductase [Chloroflexota bacterium]
MRILITGGAGFVGSHLCEYVLGQGHEVVCMDNLSTGRLENVAHLEGRQGFAFLHHDVTIPYHLDGRIDHVLNMASPASPKDYARLPLETLMVGSAGVRNGLELAREHGASFLQASTSEVYGDPTVSPQPEAYWGNVNPVGPRSMYDEAKRFAEALTMAYNRSQGVKTHIVRIFNTYGPRMRPDDGRAIPNFISQAFRNEPLTVYGDGSQTRSFCYVSDLVEGLYALMLSDVMEPVNLGNPLELSILDLARQVLRWTGGDSAIVHEPLPVDDPKIRQPDIKRAKELLGWTPTVGLEEGLERTVAWFREPRRQMAARAA